MAANKFVFHGSLSSHQINGPALVLAALILQYLVRRFPALRMTEEQAHDSREQHAQKPYFIKTKPMSEQLIEFLKAKRHAPHTFMWVPLSAWPFILGGIGMSQLLGLI
jgi:hypothetical protein